MNINVLDLVRFDPVRNCFVLKGIQMHKWPDGTHKSMHNAFNWRENATGILLNKPAPVPARAKDLNSNGSIYSYTKAKNITKFPATPRSGKLHTINKETP
jgi:hypothetical protein